jgi:CDP-diglyceride synthetase
MKKTWGFAWFSVALSAIVLVSIVFGRPEPVLPTYFCFIPVVFFMIARIIKDLVERVSHLERMLETERTRDENEHNS